jgi:hypothetical protein
VAYYAAPFTFDFNTSRVNIDAGVVAVDCLSLYTAIKNAQASEEGITFNPIAKGDGLKNIGGGILSGITVDLYAPWQLYFTPGNYTARIMNGNLIGGPAGNPIAYSAGVQTVLIQSAAATVVTISGGTGNAPTVQEIAAHIERDGGKLDIMAGTLGALA